MSRSTRITEMAFTSDDFRKVTFAVATGILRPQRDNGYDSYGGSSKPRFSEQVYRHFRGRNALSFKPGHGYKESQLNVIAEKVADYLNGIGQKTSAWLREHSDLSGISRYAAVRSNAEVVMKVLAEYAAVKKTDHLLLSLRDIRFYAQHRFDYVLSHTAVGTALRALADSGIVRYDKGSPLSIGCMGRASKIRLLCPSFAGYSPDVASPAPVEAYESFRALELDRQERRAMRMRARHYWRYVSRRELERRIFPHLFST